MNIDNSVQFPEDCLYPTDNEFGIPVLRIDRQPTNGLKLPCKGWGTDCRSKTGIAIYHFYVDDSRFSALWKHPQRALQGGCRCFVEPNPSIFDSTPIAYGLQFIYMKRWIARYWQECGASVYVDLNVPLKYANLNCMGIPDGYNAFATRGYADRTEYLCNEIEIARNISHQKVPNMIVYGGGRFIQQLCLQANIIYIEQFRTNRRNSILNG